MTCQDFRQSVHEQLNGSSMITLTPEQHGHTDSCAACRSFLASLAALDESLRHLPRVEVSPEMMSALQGIGEQALVNETLNWAPDLRRAAVQLLPLILLYVAPLFSLAAVQWTIEAAVIVLGLSIFCIETLKPVILGTPPLRSAAAVP